nr:uncharacterized protein LOC133611642 isoform X2 [Nerophis lumbriciformis]
MVESFTQEETTVVATLFQYWITDILPMKRGNESELYTTHPYNNRHSTQAYHNVYVVRPPEKTMPGLAMLLGAVGIGMCGYSSRQLALYHRPSSRVLQWVGSHTDATMAGTAAYRTPFQDVTRRAGACQEITPPSFVGQKFV